jgi:hypothetical protein
MIVEYNDTACDFVDLSIGEAFVFYEDGEKYTCIKTSRHSEAVHLATGEVFVIEPHQRVYKIKARVTIE